MTTRVGSATVELYQRGRVAVSSCRTTHPCTALVGHLGLDWNGSGWTAGPGPVAGRRPGRLGPSPACPAGHLPGRPRGCDAVRAHAGLGLVHAPDHRRQRRPRRPVVSDPAFCMAADAYGNVVHLADGPPGPAPSKVVPTPVDYAGIGARYPCPTDQFCLVLNGDGDYASYRTDPAPGGHPDRPTAGRDRARARRPTPTPARSASMATVRQLRVVATRPSRFSR